MKEQDEKSQNDYTEMFSILFGTNGKKVVLLHKFLTLSDQDIISVFTYNQKTAQQNNQGEDGGDS